MKALLTAKVGMFLVVSSVLAVWTLLAAQPSMAHDKGETLPTPRCSGNNFPGADFLEGAEAEIKFNALTLSLPTKRGNGVSGAGDIRYHYAKITIPALAAGELRVFDGTETANHVSDAVLCRGSSQMVSSRMSYTRHNNALTAADKADDEDSTTTTDDAAKATAAVTAADTARNDDTITLSAARSALTTARSALSAARTDLREARTALSVFTTTGPAATAAFEAEVAAVDAYNNSTHPSTSIGNVQELADVKAALLTASGGLTAASTALNAASTALNAAAGTEHTGFEIRTPVSPGDEEYVVVVALQNTGNPPRATETGVALDVSFHGAIDNTPNASLNLDGSLGTGSRPPYMIKITAPGLLTLETTGNTDTVGTLEKNNVQVAMAESGGSGGNFKIVAPVTAADHILYIQGQAPRPTGDYTLDMDFKVAMEHSPNITGVTSLMMVNGPNWGAVGLLDDGTDDAERPELDSTSDEDYFLFTISNSNADLAQGFLTVQAANDLMTAAARNADTTGTLYGPTGEIDTDSSSGAGSHFKISAPVEMGDYIVKVTGSVGGYLLDFALSTATDVAVRGTQGMATGTPTCASGTDNDYEICAATGATQQTDQYTLPVIESGALYINTTGSIDTVGVLYGPDGSKIAEDDNSGADNNFRIAANVDPGLHLLQVRGKSRSTTGVYQLVTSFVTGEEVTTPTRPGTGSDLQARVDELEAELAACEAPVETDARGNLGNPPDGGFRSGIGLISGWVCAAAEVEVVISPDRPGAQSVTLNVAYGTSRPDTVGRCGHRSPNTGFGMTYNFNHLPEGEYTIRAFADGDELIGEPRTFEVVHLTNFAATDRNRFLEDLPAAECRVDNFPAAGERTFLKWEQSIQNFVIEDAG